MNNLCNPQSRVKILVVDDHPNAAALLARAISQLGDGVVVISATSGDQALKCVQESTVDILITDMDMPEMTGLELIEKLNKLPAGRPTFSFLITGSHVPGLKTVARCLNVKDVLQKPIHPQRVCQIVGQALDELDRFKLHQGLETRKRFKILIVDDQSANVTLLSRILGWEGYVYVTAQNGSEMLKQVHSEYPDLILLGVNMPDLDGLAVLEEIRANPATQHIPVIVLSAVWTNVAEIQFGLNLSADDYVAEPFERRELLARIRTKLRMKEAEDVIHLFSPVEPTTFQNSSSLAQQV